MPTALRTAVHCTYEMLPGRTTKTSTEWTVDTAAIFISYCTAISVSIHPTEYIPYSLRTP